MNGLNWNFESKTIGDLPNNVEAELQRLHKLLQHEDMDIVVWAKTLIEQIHTAYFGMVFVNNYEPIPDDALKVKL